MRELLGGLRARVERRTRAWIRRRQGDDADPVELRRQRIYILPTRLGLAYGAMLFSMLLGGMNYNNNLGLALTFLLVSLGLVAMHHAHGTLAGLRVRLLEAVPGFAGDEVRFRLQLEHSSSVARPALDVSVTRSGAFPERVSAFPSERKGTGAGDGVDAARPDSVTVDLPPLGQAEAVLALPAPRRGRIALDRFIVSTSHPFGLFRAWAVIHPRYAAIAWPQAAPRALAPPRTATDTGGAQSGAVGEEDFAGLRPFQAGDSLRRVAWKAYARGQGLHTKLYAGTDVVSHVFDFDSLEGLGTEARLAQLCRWVLDAHERGEAFALRLPGTRIDTNVGLAHRERCLNALALFESLDREHG
jgi:uncharacterized protein (DUF58 family)